MDLDECLSSPCENGGQCTQTAFPGNYTCDCPDEYEGHNCEELKIKTCAQSPCLNGGHCRDGVAIVGDDLYNCDCDTGYKGVNCEIKKDFCEEHSYPCRNGATCISKFETYVS